MLLYVLGTDSPDAVRKMMALSDKSRPLNPKHAAYIHNASPNSSRRPAPPHNNAPKLGGGGGLRPPLQPVVNLSPESSSVVSLTGIAMRKSRTSGETYFILQ